MGQTGFVVVIILDVLKDQTYLTKKCTMQCHTLNRTITFYNMVVWSRPIQHLDPFGEAFNLYCTIMSLTTIGLSY